MMKKRYKVSLYILNEMLGNLANNAIDAKMFTLSNSYDGLNGVLAIYDGEVSRKGLIYLMALGIKVFPLNHYEDFIITCPKCGERINDDMILLTYDENVLSGYNINCYKENCGFQMANVELIE